MSIKIALVGNPNVGKSVIFNYLTGVYVDVSNYPGTTIEIASAYLKDSNQSIKITDTPGVYGISQNNDEEKATRDYILEADLVINVVSSITLSRDLFLTKQLADLAKPMLVVLNQTDEALLRKVAIDTELLAQKLGVNVLQAVATKAVGLDQLKDFILDYQNSFKVGIVSDQIEEYVKPFYDQCLTRMEALMMAESTDSQEAIYLARRKEVDELVKLVVSRAGFSKRVLLGQLLTSPIIGSIVAVLVLYLFLFQFLGVFVAGTVVGFVEDGFFKQYYEPFVVSVVERFSTVKFDNLENLVFNDPLAALGTFLAGDYGVLTLTITYLYGLLVPLVFGFYLGLAILEDSGYLPRLAVLADGILSRLGMNGRAIIPLILGGGCVTMAVVTTRLLTSKKEKLITMALLGLSIPCSAQLGVIQGLLTNIGGIKPWLIWSLSLVFIFGIAGTVLNKLVPGTCGNFISDIPPMRLPNLRNVFTKTYVRSKVFIDEATPAFFIAAASVAGLQITGLLKYVIDFVKPLITNVLLLPAEVSVSFILGMIRRDFGAFGLLSIPMSDAQMITACIVLTLFVPCIATFAVMVKEKNLKVALIIWLASWILAFMFGGLIARVLVYLI